jgi:hypothetical protein
MTGSGKEEMKHLLVRFVEDVPEFLNFEGEEVGPFKKEKLPI